MHMYSYNGPTVHVCRVVVCAQESMHRREHCPHISILVLSAAWSLNTSPVSFQQVNSYQTQTGHWVECGYVTCTSGETLQETTLFSQAMPLGLGLGCECAHLKQLYPGSCPPGSCPQGNVLLRERRSRGRLLCAVVQPQSVKFQRDHREHLVMRPLENRYLSHWHAAIKMLLWFGVKSESGCLSAANYSGGRA